MRSRVETLTEHEYEFPYAVDGHYLSVELTHEILEADGFDPDDYAAYVLKEGAQLATVLCDNLPESVCDAMLMTLLELKASQLRTRHGSAPPHPSGESAAGT